MTRRIPILATLVVLAAAATMVGLGLWQLERAQWKAELLARYASAGSAETATFPTSQGAVEAALYRHSTLLCDRVIEFGAVAGHDRSGTTGWAQTARCALVGGGEAEVVLGWSREPNMTLDWAGGTINGTIGPGRAGGARLIADPPLAGLQANAAPDPATIPNNHLSYAFQWFFFALTALVIYALALRKRWLAPDNRSD